MNQNPTPLGTRILIISAMMLIIAFAGFLVLAARSCGGDEPPPAITRFALPAIAISVAVA